MNQKIECIVTKSKGTKRDEKEKVGLVQKKYIDYARICRG